MKNFLFSLAVIFSISLWSQEKINEPDFIGEAFILNPDQSILKMEKQTVQMKTKAGASVFLTGIGKVKTKIQIDGCCSNSVYTPVNDEIKIVVRAVDNETDPLSIIQIFKFDKRSKKRLAELSSVGTFAGGSSNNLEYLRFSAEKYGKNSYLLTINTFEKDVEYGLIVNNPNALDQKSIVVSTFSVQ